MKSKKGFLLMWMLLVFAFFISWASFTLSEINETLGNRKKILVIDERLKAEKLMISHFESNSSRYEYYGKHLNLFAVKEDKKIVVNVVGTTNLNYVYGIIEDGSLVLETMEE